MFGSYAQESMLEKYKVPDLEARRVDPKHKCNCAHYLGDEEYASLLLGKTLRCHRCQSPMWLDETFFITNPTYVRIFYCYGKKWHVMNSWYLAYYYSLIKENPSAANSS